MINFDTEKKLAELFFETISGEKYVEECRFILCRSQEFEITSAFRELDRIGMGSISCNDLKSFLDKNRVQCTSEEAYLIIRHYDRNSDGRLSLEEFASLVHPSTLPLYNDSRPTNSKLTFDVEILLSSLLEGEVRLQRKLELLKKDLISSEDFNLMEGFRSLDKRNQAIIDEDALFSFLRRNGYSVVEMDMQHVLKRVDKDNDKAVSYIEFVDFVLPNKPHYREKSPSKSVNRYSPARKNAEASRTPEKVTVRNSSPLRYSKMSIASSVDKSRNEKTANNVSPSSVRITHDSYKDSYEKSTIRNFSPLRKSSLLQSTSPFRRSNLAQNSSKVSRDSNSYQTSHSPILVKNSYQTSLTPTKHQAFDSKELISIFQEEISMLRDIEVLKKELSLRADFNLIDAFKMLDLHDKGQIDIADIEEFTKEFSLGTDREEIYLLIQHFSSIQDCRLRFSDFCEIFTSIHEDYSRLVKNRPALNLPLFQRYRVFSKDTLDLFIQTLRSLLYFESKSENLRQRISRSSDFNVQEAFQSLDKDRKGFITAEELKRILDNNGIFPSSADISNLMRKYDKNKDGRVSFTEFIQEITSKSPKKY